MDSSESEETNESRIEPEMSDEPSSSRVASIAWKHFDIVAPDSKLASCNICKKILSFRSSVSNLIKHIKKVHRGTSDVIEKALNYNSSDESSENTSKSLIKIQNASTSHNTSPIWNHYTVTDGDEKKATCRYCLELVSFTINTRDLKSHLKSNHEDIYSTLKDLDSESEDEPKSNRKRSPVWYYFKTLDPVLRIAMCHICKNRLSYTTVSNLSKHLKRRHPNAAVTKVKDGTEIMLGTDGQLYEIESKRSESDHDEHDQDTLDMDPIYLDEYEGLQNTDESIPSKKGKIVYKNTRSEDNSRNEVFYKIPVTKEPDTLGHFANYITALLRELPKTISDQLQADIVKQILAAKISNEITSTAAVIPNNSYSITFNNEQNNETISNDDEKLK